MKRYFTIGLLLIFVNSGLSQNADSLKGILPFKKNQVRADLLLALSKTYWHRNYDSALLYASEALQLSKNISYERGIAEAYRHIGVINMFGSKAQIAEPYLDTALTLFQNLHDSPGIAATYNNIGVLLNTDLGRYNESIFAFEQALSLFQKLGNSEGTGSVLNYIGINYERQGNFQKAIEYTLQGMQVRKKIDDIQGVMFSLSRVGQLYMAVGQSDTALKYLMNALHFAREKKVEPLTDTYEYIANVYLEWKQYKEAKKYLDLALKGNSEWYRLLLGRFYIETGQTEEALTVYKQVMARTLKTTAYMEQASSMMGICRVYLEKKNHQLAIRYAKDAYDVASTHNIRWIIADASNVLSSLYATQGNYHSAYNYGKIYRSISDSVSKVDAHLKLAFLESKNEIIEKQSRIELLDKENKLKEERLKTEALIKRFFIAGIAVIVIIAFVLFRNISLKRKNEKNLRELAENELQIQKLESEKTKAELQHQAITFEMQSLRAQMNPHFIFNSLHSINKYIMENEKQNASEYLSKFAKLMRLVLENSRETEVLLEKDLSALELYMQLEALRFQQRFHYNIEIDPQIDQENTLIPPLLLQPFVENSIIHGMKNKECGLIKIKVEKEDGMMRCTVEDNGMGREQSRKIQAGTQQKQESLGMKITKERLEMINETKKTKTAINIYDLKDAANKPTGLRIELLLPYEEAF
jgi:tetratricopeptide (TPR) repeat protein